MDCRRKVVLQVMAVAIVLLAVYLAFPYNKGKHCKNGSNSVPAAIYNFGDSNSDTGSYTAAVGRLLPPYGMTRFGKPIPRRFTDGRLIIDFIVETLKLPYLRAYLDSIGFVDFGHGANFASAGSTIQHLNEQLFNEGYNNSFTLDVQVTQFEQFNAQRLGQGDCKLSRALVTIDHGQNDLHAGLTSRTEDEVIASIPNIINDFSIALQRLYEVGARSYWIHNTGPIGCLPWFLIRNPPDPINTDPIGCIKSFNLVAQVFNDQLKNKISELRNQFEDAVIIHIDIYSIKYSLISQGQYNGFPDPHGYCCGKIERDSLIRCGEKKVINGKAKYVCCDNPSKYISWDGIHYTDAANKWISGRIFKGLFSEPELLPWLAEL